MYRRSVRATCSTSRTWRRPSVRPNPWRWPWGTILGIGLAWTCLATSASGPRPPLGQPPQPVAAITRRVNAPYLDTGTPFTPAIFWLGQVDSTHAYADVRLDYTPDNLAVVVHIIDRRLWYEPTPTGADLPNWDAVSLYLRLNGPLGGAPDSSSYRFDVEVGNNFQASYRGNGAAWTASSITTTAYTDWRGASGPNSGQDSEGWVAHFYVPYSSLGLARPPTANTQWGLSLVVHDRDSQSGPALPDTLWPETANPD